MTLMQSNYDIKVIPIMEEMVAFVGSTWFAEHPDNCLDPLVSIEPTLKAGGDGNGCHGNVTSNSSLNIYRFTDSIDDWFVHSNNAMRRNHKPDDVQECSNNSIASFTQVPAL